MKQSTLDTLNLGPCTLGIFVLYNDLYLGVYVNQTVILLENKNSFINYLLFTFLSLSVWYWHTNWRWENYKTKSFTTSNVVLTATGSHSTRIFLTTNYERCCKNNSKHRNDCVFSIHVPYCSTSIYPLYHWLYYTDLCVCLCGVCWTIDVHVREKFTVKDLKEVTHGRPTSYVYSNYSRPSLIRTPYMPWNCDIREVGVHMGL